MNEKTPAPVVAAVALDLDAMARRYSTATDDEVIYELWPALVAEVRRLTERADHKSALAADNARRAEAAEAEVRRLTSHADGLSANLGGDLIAWAARAEAAEAEVGTLRAQVKGLHEELLRGDPDVVTLRARLAAVEALADQWADRKRSDGMSGNAWIGLTLSGVAADLRAALATTGEGQRPKCDTCNDTGRCDWSPGEHRDTEEWDRPCIDHCDATTGEGE